MAKGPDMHDKTDKTHLKIRIYFFEIEKEMYIYSLNNKKTKGSIRHKAVKCVSLTYSILF